MSYFLMTEVLRPELQADNYVKSQREKNGPEPTRKTGKEPDEKQDETGPEQLRREQLNQVRDNISRAFDRINRAGHSAVGNKPNRIDEKSQVKHKSIKI